MDCFQDLQGVYDTAMINVLEDLSQFMEDLFFLHLYLSLKLFNINFFGRLDLNQLGFKICLNSSQLFGKRCCNLQPMLISELANKKQRVEMALI